MKSLVSLVLALAVVVSRGQDYYSPPQQDDYANDNLYHDYAARQQEKQVGPVGLPWTKLAVATAAGWFLGGKYHAGKLRKKLNQKHKQEQKELYTQYYNDVYTLKDQNMQLVSALEQMGVKIR